MLGIDTYTAQFVAVSASSVRETRLNDSGRVLLPPSALQTISNMRMVYPLQFKITAYRQKPVYAAVLEFDAEMGTAVLPDWMFEQLQLKPRSVVRLDTCSLAAGHIVKLRPHKKEFVMLTDPRAVLEQRLASYPVLSAGSTILIHYANRPFMLDVVEIMDLNDKSVDAVLTARADGQATELKVEFERPLDMPPSPTEHEEEETGYTPITFGGTNVIGPSSIGPGVQYKAYAYKPPTLSDTQGSPDEESFSGDQKITQNKTAFIPFAGSGRTLSGAPASGAATASPSSATTSQNNMPSREEQEKIREKRLQALNQWKPQ